MAPASPNRPTKLVTLAIVSRETENNTFNSQTFMIEIK
jgi:hypothetical protein